LTWTIEYKSSVIRDLRRLDREVAMRILDEIERSLGGDPSPGEALTGTFKGLYKYRVGEYRVIFARFPDKILILRIGHRRSAYR